MKVTSIRRRRDLCGRAPRRKKRCASMSKSRNGYDAAFCIMDDDAQDGPDHVDSHREMMCVTYAYNRPGLHHRFTNTTDVGATIEQILGIAPMSQFDHYSRPLHDVF